MTRALVLAMCIVVSVACQTKYRGVVSVDETDVEQTAQSTGASTSVYPPMCSGIELPEYPETPTEEQRGRVLIRVDFAVEEDGSTSDIAARALESHRDTSLFETISVSTVASWTCNPAWRLRRNQSEPPGPIPVRYRTYVVFRFDTEAVGRKVAMQPQDTTPSQ